MAVTSAVALAEELRRLQILDSAQMQELDGSLLARFPEPRELARELVRRGWLTPHQVNQIMKGQGAELVLGSYILLEQLGEGGMGAVFKARHRTLGRVAALKLIRKERLDSPDAIRRFRREVQAAAQLSHPNVVHAFDADEVNGTHFLVMEHVDGGTDLAKLVKGHGPLAPAVACEYVRQAALGLQHAHERAMVHRDVKPHNLLLTADGTAVKILDMGLARLDRMPDNATASSMTDTGCVMGTPDYMAPEQARNSHTADIRSDIYSLGCTLYFLLTGQTPFPTGTITEKLLQHVIDEPRPVESLRPEVPAAVSAVLRRMMAKKPEERYQTPGEAAVALAGAASAEADAPAPDHTVALATGIGDRPALPPSAGDTINSALEYMAAAEPVKTDPRGRASDWALFRTALAGGGILVGLLLVLFLGLAIVRKNRPDPISPDLDPRPAKPNVGAVRPTPVDKAWIESVQKMTADKQVDAVILKLRELNPAFDGKDVERETPDAVVGRLSIPGFHITDLSPLQALKHLRSLTCYGQSGRPSPLSDISPLRGLPLEQLSLQWTAVSDVSPLAECRRLSGLTLGRTQVKDLAPLAGLPLRSLNVAESRVHDLSPLRGMPLTFFACSGTDVWDLSPLRDSPLAGLLCQACKVHDLSPLCSKPMRSLQVDGNPIDSLAPLRGMPLDELGCPFSLWRDREVIDSLKDLTRINSKDAKEFRREMGERVAEFERWSAGLADMPIENQVRAVSARLRTLNPGYDGKMSFGPDGGLTLSADSLANLEPIRALRNLKRLTCEGSAPGKGRLADLSPLHGLSLSRLVLSNTDVADLTALADMPLVELYLSHTRVRDLAPLAATKTLSILDCGNTAVTDLTPLKNLALSAFYCPHSHLADIGPLAGQPLAIVRVDRTRVGDLTPLAKAPLRTLDFEVRSPDLCAPIRSIDSFTKINGKLPAEFWRLIDAQKAEFAKWRADVAAMTLEQQSAAVGNRLKQQNPGFKADWKQMLTGPRITGLQIFCQVPALTNLSALRGFPALEQLSIHQAGDLSDLWTLHGLRLTRLALHGNRVSDLTPLRQMPLEQLGLIGTPEIRDLTPLKGLKLNGFIWRGAPPPSFEPLADMPLVQVEVEGLDNPNAELLRKIKSLKTINGKPADVFWKEYGSRK